MTLKLTLFSQEKEDFVREILIGSDATFAELHQLILNDCSYDEHPRQCFLICDEDWRVRQRISLQDIDELSYDQDIHLMADIRVGDCLEDEGQRLAYVFDPEGKRLFLMELTENVFGRTEKEAFINRRHGQPPLQNPAATSAPETSPDEEEIAENASEFYGDEDFEAEELDMEGYEIEE